MKKLGFGCMRLPMENGIVGMDGDVDYTQFNKMIDTYMEEGFNYFDTARGYINGKSEIAIRDCLVNRYPRDSYILVDKLTGMFFNKEEEILPFFESQLEVTGVSYFDYYLMHALTAKEYEKFTTCNAFEIVKQLKKEGKIKHIGISFHDKADVLDKILSEHSEIEVVQIQFNYADYNDPSIQSEEVYEVCRKYNKEILIMEPVKGGGLVNLPPEAKTIFDQLDGGSYASYAIRYAASFEGVIMVLSGMSDYEQMKDNLSYMKNFKPLNEEEFKAIEEVQEILKNQDNIACTSCHYCTAECPKNILIPNLFGCMNAKNQYKDWNSDFYYNVHTTENGKASDCIACGKCEKACPQHLEIIKLLKDVASTFEKQNS